jgi:hypothetical protein
VGSINRRNMVPAYVQDPTTLSKKGQAQPGSNPNTGIDTRLDIAREKYIKI